MGIEGTHASGKTTVVHAADGPLPRPRGAGRMRRSSPFIEGTVIYDSTNGPRPPSETAASGPGKPHEDISGTTCAVAGTAGIHAHQFVSKTVSQDQGPGGGLAGLHSQVAARPGHYCS